MIVTHFGKPRSVADVAPDDFMQLRQKLAQKNSPVSLGNLIQRVRTVFKPKGHRTIASNDPSGYTDPTLLLK